MNNEPDFSKYSYYELLDAVANIDQEKYPDRYSAAVSSLSSAEVPAELVAKGLESVSAYAGFWKRLGAAIIDLLIVVPIAVLANSQIMSPSKAMIFVVVLSLLFNAYTIYFHYKFGATLGKMALGIKVTLLNGDRIGIKQAVLRSSVDVILVIFIIVAQVLALSKADPEIYSRLDWMGRAQYTTLLFPVWYGLVNLISQFWYWGEFVVLLFNKKKRAIHDFIAGTIVVNGDVVA